MSLGQERIQLQGLSEIGFSIGRLALFPEGAAQIAVSPRAIRLATQCFLVARHGFIQSVLIEIESP